MNWAEERMNALIHENFVIASMMSWVTTGLVGLALIPTENVDANGVLWMGAVIFGFFTLIYFLQGVSFKRRLRQALSS